jgi:phosphate butyryltransferase
MIITSLKDAYRVAKKKGPKRLGVLAPEDSEFMLAIRQSWQMGYVEPILIGHNIKMDQTAEMIGFDISGFEKIAGKNYQGIADFGIGMLFSGNVDIVIKDQIPTSDIYATITRAESGAGSGMSVNFISIWDIPGLDHLVMFADSGSNFGQEDKKKAVAVLKNAVFLCRLLGYSKPKIAVLSDQRILRGMPPPSKDYEFLKGAVKSGYLGECEMIDATSFTGMFLGPKGKLTSYSDIDLTRMPHILLVPNLSSENIICKLDFFIEVIRCSLVVTSAGAGCIPAQSDFSDSIVAQIAMGVVIADRMKNSR